MGAKFDGESDGSCTRDDGRDLTQVWRNMKDSQGLTSEYVDTREDLLDIDTDETDSILGKFVGCFSKLRSY